MFKKSLVIFVGSFLSSSLFCAPPSNIHELKDINALEASMQFKAWETLKSYPTWNSFKNCMGCCRSLAFGKAYEFGKFDETKHFAAQYRMLIIDTAYNGFREKNSKDVNLVCAIKNELEAFFCENFQETLTEQEYEYFLKLSKDVLEDCRLIENI